MPETPQSIIQSMKAIVAALQKQLDDLNKDIGSRLPNKKRKYSAEERDALNNVAAKLSEEIFHRQNIASFEAATFTVVHQPTEAEVNDLKATLVELGKPLTEKAGADAVVKFINGLLTASVKSLADLNSSVKPKK